MTVRTRMAPSPTGEYHIGGLRTFLYNYAFAKKNNGAMILRIEDTDKEREVEGVLQRIIDVIHDYGLGWDEGPFIQSQRLDLYKKHGQELVEKNHAYYCFCSPERLKNLREQQISEGKITKYDRHCLKLTHDEVKKKLETGENYVIRMKAPDDVAISWNDEILGEITINSSELDDQVLLKSDGYPTYHLAVVVDDHYMNISHVLRGMEWLPSTPKHILLFNYFEWNLPKFGHLPNLKEVGSNKKLSKRFGDVHAEKFLENGYLPEAVLNFVMFLGWNPGTDQEVYSLEEFINDFTLERVHKTDLVAFDREKLVWYNGVYIRNMSPESLWERIKQWAEKYSVNLVSEGFDDDYVIKVLSTVQERMKLLSEFNLLTEYFFTDKFTVNSADLAKFAKDKTTQILKLFIDEYSKVDESLWNSENLDSLSHEVINNHGYKPKEAFMTIRIAVTGNTATPPLFDVLELLGKEEVLKRLNLNV